jgi:pantoate--beta-alanine ligase
MNVYHTRNSLKVALQEVRLKGETIGFVPTMGALHDGHLSLVKQALEQTDRVVVSIFVNPIQFNNAADLAEYPSMLDEDINMLSEFENILIFAPTSSEIYPENDAFKVLFTSLIICLKLWSQIKRFLVERIFNKWRLSKKW